MPKSQEALGKISAWNGEKEEWLQTDYQWLHSLSGRQKNKSSFCCLYPIGTFWGKTQRVCWGGGRSNTGGDLRYPHVKQPNHSGETVREEGCHEVLPGYYRRFICLALSLPLFNPQRFWTLSGVKNFFCLERVPLITLADCTWGQLVYLLNESSISCTIWAMEW